MVSSKPHLLEWVESKGEGSKLTPRWIGPFEITECINPKVYCLHLPDKYPGSPIFNIEHLKPYQELADGDRTIMLESTLRREESQEYEVKSILGHKRISNSKTLKYLVRWSGYGPQFNEWLIARNLHNASDILWEYRKHNNIWGSLSLACPTTFTAGCLPLLHFILHSSIFLHLIFFFLISVILFMLFTSIEFSLFLFCNFLSHPHLDLTLLLQLGQAPVTSMQGPDKLLWTASSFFSSLSLVSFVGATPNITLIAPPDLGLTGKGLLHNLSAQSMQWNMSSANFYLDKHDRALEVSLFNHDWADWVGLNADMRKIPPGARYWKDLMTIEWDTAEVTSSGSYAELEWTIHPDWYQHNTHWWGFGPTQMAVTPSTGSPWYLDMDAPMAYCTVEGGYLFMEIQWGNITNDLIFFDHCLEEVVGSQWFLDDSPVPPAYDCDRLSSTFQSIIMLQREGAAAKRVAWDHLMFLTWWTKACNSWAEGVNVIIVEQVEGIVSRGRNPGGFLFDLLSDWHEMNVPFLFLHSISFYYTFSL